MKYILVLICLILFCVKTYSQDSITAIKNDGSKISFAISIGSFFSPKISSTNLIDYKNKLCYSIQGGLVYELNDKFSVQTKLGITKYFYHFSYYNNFDNNTVIYDVKSIRYKIGVLNNYNLINNHRYNIFIQIGSSFFSGIRNNIKFSGITPPLSTRDGSGENLSFEFCIGLTYKLTKKSVISINGSLTKYLFQNYLFYPDDKLHINKEIIPLTISYIQRF